MSQSAIAGSKDTLFKVAVVVPFIIPAIWKAEAGALQLFSPAQAI